MTERELSTVTWRKSSYSSSAQGECVEVARAGEYVVVRDSKDPFGPVLLLSPSAFHGVLRHGCA